MSNLSTLPKGDSAWLLRKAIERIIQQISVLETNIGSSTTGNSANTQVIFNDAGTLRGDAGLTYNKTTDLLTVGAATITGDLTVDTNTLKVVSSLDFVGIGATTQSFGEKFRINGNYTVMNDGTFTGFLGKASAIGASGATSDFGIRSENNLLFLTNGANLQMTLNSTGLGVGGSPSYKVSAIGTTNNQVVLHVGNTAGSVDGDTTNVVRFAAGSGANALWANARYDGFSHAWRCNSTTTQAMTLDASGNLILGGTSQIASCRSSITNAGGDQLAINATNTSTGQSSIKFCNAGTAYGYIWWDKSDSRLYVQNTSGGVYLASTATSWTANSDERLKDIIEPISNAVSKVGSLRAIIGKYKNDQTNTRRSFLIAQDVQSVLPEAVDASNPDQLGVAYTDVIPLLVAAIKELTARVEALES
jgi:hypothetical protein